MLHFAKWVALAAVFTVLAQRIDVLMLGAFAVPDTAVGHYGAAVHLGLVGELAVMTLFSVMLPKASQVGQAGPMRVFLRKSCGVALLVGLGLLPLLFVAGPLVRLTFGGEFEETSRLFPILLGGTLLSLFCAPAGAAVYGLGKSHLIAMLEGLKLLLIVVGGLWLVPLAGVYGVAWTIAAAKGTIGIMTYVAALMAIGRSERDAGHGNRESTQMAPDGNGTPSPSPGR